MSRTQRNVILSEAKDLDHVACWTTAVSSGSVVQILRCAQDDNRNRDAKKRGRAE
jgi:hypothetical protein